MMFSTKNSISDYFNKLIINLDIITEELLIQYVSQIDEQERLGSIRDKMVSKLQNIEHYNLEHFGKDLKFCFFVPNTKRDLPNLDRKGYKFSNRIGVLIILDEFLPKEVLNLITDVMNQKNIELSESQIKPNSKAKHILEALSEDCHQCIIDLIKSKK
ncbi:unnamed protein product [Brachionus calyciflorus]|uniref:Uncharacterized protein n=1 Tax=Brachionus calyciflorus TaxID=104777 RepID=A0A814CRB0_9BILA|nr:unnamed protein product [Brachionus calyciflorus]